MSNRNKKNYKGRTKSDAAVDPYEAASAVLQSLISSGRRMTVMNKAPPHPPLEIMCTKYLVFNLKT